MRPCSPIRRPVPMQLWCVQHVFSLTFGTAAYRDFARNAPGADRVVEASQRQRRKHSMRADRRVQKWGVAMPDCDSCVLFAHALPGSRRPKIKIVQCLYFLRWSCVSQGNNALYENCVFPKTISGRVLARERPVVFTCLGVAPACRVSLKSWYSIQRNKKALCSTKLGVVRGGCARGLCARVVRSCARA